MRARATSMLSLVKKYSSETQVEWETLLEKTQEISISKICRMVEDHTILKVKAANSIIVALKGGPSTFMNRYLKKLKKRGL